MHWIKLARDGALAVVLFVVALVASLGSTACAPRTSAISASNASFRSGSEILDAAPVDTFRVDTSALAPELNRLPVDERAEQLADWAVAGTLTQMAQGDPDALDAVARRPWLRSRQFEVLGVFDYGASRRVILNPSRALLFTATTDANPRRTLAALADRVRAELGRIPERFEVLRFTPAADGREILVARQGAVRGSELFGPTYGYVEQEIGSAAELGAWVSRGAQLTHYALLGDRFLLGGRSLDDATPRVTLDDVAALYQGHLASWPGLAVAHRLDRDLNRLASASTELVESYNADVDRVNSGRAPSCSEFDRALEKLARAFGDAEPEMPVACTAASSGEVLRARGALLERLKPVLAKAVAAQSAAIETALRNSEQKEGPGFSLDPQWDRARLIADLTLLETEPRRLVERARQLPRAAHPNRGSSYPVDTASALLEVVARIGSDDVGALDPSVVQAIDAIIQQARASDAPLIDLPVFARVRSALEQSKSPQGILLAREMQFIEASSRVQCARYEGALGGTRVGMNLFYTDLLAKLWAGLDYRASAPTRKLPGFGTMQGLPVHADESSTRIWFGPRIERITRNDDYSTVDFSPGVTRVYSAASDVTHPGTEAVPDDEVRHVLDWWTNHFESVAGIDRQYELQNELQKWSLLTGVLAYQDILPELEGIRVERDNRFDDWAKRTPHTQLPPGISLLPQNRWIGKDRAWECIDLLASDDPSGVRVIYGGVSLADLTHASLPSFGARTGAYRPDPDPGRVALSLHDDADHARHYVEIPPSRLAPNTEQQRTLLASARHEGAGIALEWEGGNGRGARIKADWSHGDVVLSAANLDPGARSDLHAFAQSQRLQAEIANAKALDAQAARTPRLRRTQHRAGDDDPPSAALVEMKADWRAALRGGELTPTSPNDHGER